VNVDVVHAAFVKPKYNIVGVEVTVYQCAEGRWEKALDLGSRLDELAKVVTRLKQAGMHRLDIIFAAE
jgi:hypothetical protein